jgi:hypothetical protein
MAQVKKIQIAKPNNQGATKPAHVPPAMMPKPGKGGLA